MVSNLANYLLSISFAGIVVFLIIGAVIFVSLKDPIRYMS